MSKEVRIVVLLRSVESGKTQKHGEPDVLREQAAQRINGDFEAVRFDRGHKRSVCVELI